MQCLKNTVVLFGFIAGTFLPVAAFAQSQRNYQAQNRQQPARSSGLRIGLVDVAHVFKNHPALKGEQQVLQKKAKLSSEELAKKKQQLEIKGKQLKTYKVGSKDHADLEARLVHDTSQLQLEMKRVRENFENMEADVYFRFYQQISGLVQQIARARGFEIVLRFDGNRMAKGDKESVARGLSKTVVYHYPKADITLEVMKHLTQQTASRSQARRR